MNAKRHRAVEHAYAMLLRGLPEVLVHAIAEGSHHQRILSDPARGEEGSHTAASQSPVHEAG